MDFPGAIETNYFDYNAVGERIRKRDSTSSEKTYLWDGLTPVIDFDAAAAQTQVLVKGHTPIAGIGEFVFQDLGGRELYPHKNQVGTTMRITDDTGAVINTYEYDAWGQPYPAPNTVSDI